jgi:uncharacterized protein YndB with AHSA1/START domain
MAEQLEIEASGTTTAPPSAVWSLIEDARRYPEWGAWSEGGYERPGDGSPRGVGAIQRFRYGRTISIERIVDVQPGRSLAYELVSGIPVRNYHAVVELTPAAGGTRIRWSARFDRTLVGRLVRGKLQRFYDDMLARLVAAANAASNAADAADVAAEARPEGVDLK